VQAYTVELANAVCEDLLLLVFASSGKVIMLSLINKHREKILGIVGAINIFEEPDLIVWTLNSNGFSHQLSRGPINPHPCGLEADYPS